MTNAKIEENIPSLLSNPERINCDSKDVSVNIHTESVDIFIALAGGMGFGSTKLIFQYDTRAIKTMKFNNQNNQLILKDSYSGQITISGTYEDLYKIYELINKILGEAHD